MQFHNIRLGYATNSSSSHSIVINRGGTQHCDTYEDGYGWGDFFLTEKTSKLHYLGSMVLQSLGHGPACDELLDIIEEYHPDFKDWFKSQPEHYIDHDSAFSVNPLKVNSLAALLSMDKVAIRGGNDNSPGLYDGVGEDFPIDPRSAKRVKVEGDYVVMMGSRGDKARFSFNPAAVPYVKSEVPELVDVKITDYCNRGCNFCYQSSTTAGQHAPLEDIIRTFDMLAEMDVFEVALGGGEPTSHPQFVEILKAASARKIVPNFTTLSDKWLEDEEVVMAVKRMVGGIGVSCLDAKGLALAEKIDQAVGGYSGSSVMAQHVLESVPFEVTLALISESLKANRPILLLGYKNVGFGHSYKRFEVSEEKQIVMANLIKDWSGRIRLSVDTAVVDQHHKFLEVLEVDPILVSSPEGKFSCYIDCVLGKMAKSSYVEPDEYVALPSSVEEFKAIYKEY